MGSLTPGATYIYERAGSEIYAREVGSTDRKLVGYHLPDRRDPLQYDIIETQLWQDICAAGRDDPVLQKAIDQCKLLYYLSKDKPIEVPHHPV
jgi:hypothetical protein